MISGLPPPQAIEKGRNGKSMILDARGELTWEDGSPVKPDRLAHRLLDLPAAFRGSVTYPGIVSDDTGEVRKNLLKSKVAANVVSFVSTAAVASSLLHTHIPLLAGLGVAGATIQVGLQNGLDPIGTVIGGRHSQQVDDDVPGAMRKAEVLSAAGNVLQSSLLAVPGAYVVAAPVGSALQAWASTIRGSAQASMDQHTARQGQIAAVRGTNTVQELAATAMGQAIGFGLSFIPVHLAGLPHPLALAVVPVAAALDIYYNRKAARALHMDNMTIQSVSKIVRTQLYSPEQADKLTPATASDKAYKLPRQQAPVEMGVGLQDMAQSARFAELRSLYGGDRYMLDYDGEKIRVAFRPEVKDSDLAADKVRAMIQAQLLREIVACPAFQAARAQDEAAARTLAVELSYAATPQYLETFMTPYRSHGWNPEAVAIRSEHSFYWQPGNPSAALGKADFSQIKSFTDGNLTVDAARALLHPTKIG